MPTIHFRRVERRRTARVAMFVDLVVQGHSDDDEKFKVRTRTLSVSGHGGSMVLEFPVSMGQTLLLTNEYTGERTESRVVGIRTNRDGHTHVAFEFMAPGINFWKMAFPAAGSRPVRRVIPTAAIA
jgi:c-di-GMP-binding flagellar brake protein YcgR